MINQVEAKPGTGMSYDLSFPANCPACKESLHPWLGATGGKCSVCINPHCSAGAEHPRLSPAPAPESQGESVAAPAEVGQVGGTQSVLQQLRRDWLVVFLALGFVAPIFLSALLVAVLWIAVFVEANYSEYSGAIYGWSLWLFICLFSAIWCYRAEKREKGL